MTKFRKPYTVKEVEHCVDMYMALNDFSFLPADRDKAISELAHAVRVGRFVRVAEVDGMIRGWIYARDASIGHISNRTLQQHYYASEYTGIKAYRMLVEMHEEMYNFAEQNSYELVMSAGSHMDASNVLARSLAKNGWDTRGYLAVRKTTHYNRRGNGP